MIEKREPHYMEIDRVRFKLWPPSEYPELWPSLRFKTSLFSLDDDDDEDDKDWKCIIPCPEGGDNLREQSTSSSLNSILFARIITSCWVNEQTDIRRRKHQKKQDKKSHCICYVGFVCFYVANSCQCFCCTLKGPDSTALEER